MIPVTQTKVVIKNAAGEMVQRGNCWAACIASIMEMQITDVPNVETLYHINDTLADEVMHAWLSSYGWELMTDNRFALFHGGVLDETPEDLKECIDKLYLASGLSPRGVQHCCIYCNGLLVHDPYPTREGLITFEYFETLEKINA